MFTVADLDLVVSREFNALLQPVGFRQVERRRWVRATKLPLREIITMEPRKGCGYSPTWGFSCGYVPVSTGKKFRRVTSDKNARYDLLIEPIDDTGSKMDYQFSFLEGYTKVMPEKEIAHCVKRTLENSAFYFNMVHAVDDFCDLFFKRSLMKYSGLGFNNYIWHLRAFGFVLLLSGRTEEGAQKIAEYCKKDGFDVKDPILLEYVEKAMMYFQGKGKQL